MHAALTLEDINRILTIAGVMGFTSKFVALGGGEVNDTYKLDCGNKLIILRIAKDKNHHILEDEARALRLMDLPQVPKLIFFDKNQSFNDRMWILETCVPGSTKERLSIEQFRRLGSLLARVHKIPSGQPKISLWGQFLHNCRSFGDEQSLLDHPNADLRRLIREAHEEFKQEQPLYDKIASTLIHSDATPSNILVDGDDVRLIDWEFSKFDDPMADFSTVYYEDIEYNQGKWRIKIQPNEKEALFRGYELGGGKIDEERIRFWIRFDKLGATIFLYWRLHSSTRDTTQPQIEQYQLDFDNLVSSLSRELSAQ